jgi:FAD-linked oxidoreductase
VTGHVFRNWTRDQQCAPRRFEQPDSTAGIRRVLEQAHDAGDEVRVVGAGHSFNDLVVTRDVLVSLRRMRRVLDVDRASGLVRVQAGVRLGELSAALWDHGLALPTLSDVDVQSIAGAVATGSHGTGARVPGLSSQLRAIELVTADGRTLEISAAEGGERWRAAMVNLGTLGVMSEVTLAAEPAFMVEGVDVARPREEVFERLDELADGSEHFEFFVFPHSPLATTRTNRRVGETRPEHALRTRIGDRVVHNLAFGGLCRLARARPALIPRINRVVGRVGGRERRRVDRSYRVFASERRVRFSTLEYAVPRAHAAAAVREVCALADQEKYGVFFPIQVRFSAADDALLSPASGRDSCYVGVIMYHGSDWEPYFRATDEILAAHDGRPHWAKLHYQRAETLAPRYPEWDAFQRVRSELDPDGRFANEYVRRTLGSPAPAKQPAAA